MTTAVTSAALCFCGHMERRHNAGDGMCFAGECGCLEFRPSPNQPAPAPSVAARAAVQATVNSPAAAPSSPGALLLAAKASGDARVVALAERLERDLGVLAGKLRDLDGKARIRADIAHLERELAEKKAALKGAATNGCPVAECGRAFESPQALAMHRRRAHEGFDPVATRAARDGA